MSSLDSDRPSYSTLFAREVLWAPTKTQPMKHPK